MKDSGYTMRGGPGRNAAFTLIELLVTIGLLAALAGVLVSGLRPSETGGFALQTAQSEVVAAVALARSQAVLRQVRARVLVHATPPPGGDAERHLRCVQVVCEEEPGSAVWTTVDRPLFLPANIYVVPPAAAGEGGDAPVSTLTRGTVVMRGSRIESLDALYLEVSPDGRAVAASFVLAAVRRQRGVAPDFGVSRAFRVVHVRSSGVVSAMDEGEGF